jgi:hypothetical protein
MSGVPTPQEIASWTPEDRARVARSLDSHIPRPNRQKRTRRQRRLLIALTVVSAVVLLPWIGLLSVTLRETSSGGAWRIAWVGFDTALFLSFAVSGYFVWKRRQIAPVVMAVTATLVFTDAWFDLTLSWNTPEFTVAMLSALIIEIPLAFVLVFAATKMLRMNASMVRALRGHPKGPVRATREVLPMVPVEE